MTVKGVRRDSLLGVFDGFLGEGGTILPLPAGIHYWEPQRGSIRVVGMGGQSLIRVSCFTNRLLTDKMFWVWFYGIFNQAVITLSVSNVNNDRHPPDIMGSLQWTNRSPIVVGVPPTDSGIGATLLRGKLSNTWSSPRYVSPGGTGGKTASSAELTVSPGNSRVLRFVPAAP